MSDLKIIVIDPHKKEIYYDVIKDFEDIHTTLINKKLNSRVFDIVRVKANVVLFIDDEGLLFENKYFALDGNVFAGKSFLCQVDDNGDVIDCRNDIDVIKKITQWMPDDHIEYPMMEFIAFDTPKDKLH